MVYDFPNNAIVRSNPVRDGSRGKSVPSNEGYTLYLTQIGPFIVFPVCESMLSGM
jgi:hypothetical protein